MKRLPPNVVQKETRIRAALARGVHWSQLGGHKMAFDKNMISFPLPSWYRLVCWFSGGQPYRIRTMTHEEYNSFASNTKR